VPRPPQARPGLQAERTQLSWERSAIGFLVSAALVLLRPTGPLAVGRTILAIAAVLLALLVVWLGHVRGQRIRATRLIAGKNVVASPRIEVLLIGLATAGFATTIVVVLVYSR
jgi:putative membrane protein